MDDETEVFNLWRIRKIILQMCHDRGYLVSQEELDEDLVKFKDIFGDKPSEDKPARSNLNVLVAHNDDPQDRLIVRFVEEIEPGKRIGLPQMREFCRRIQNDDVSTVIMVVKTGVTSTAREFIIEQMQSKKNRFQVFLENELLVNITEHNLVPKHVILTDDEKQELLQRYRLKENQLPRIQVADPVARYYGLVRGQVVRITRVSETAGRYITYRAVI